MQRTLNVLLRGGGDKHEYLFLIVAFLVCQIFDIMKSQIQIEKTFLLVIFLTKFE
jgi:hypothetical protein